MSNVPTPNNPELQDNNVDEPNQTVESPDSLYAKSLDKLRSGVDRVTALDAKLSEIGSKKARKRAKDKVSIAQADQEHKEPEKNWPYFVRGYRKVTRLARRNMFFAVEYLRTLRQQMFTYTDSKRKKPVVARLVTALYLFFTL